MDDPREKLSSHISIDDGNIRPFEGFIFLCGGSVDATSHRPVSIRDALCREIAKEPALERRTRLAEDYKDWSFDGHYKDLSTFVDHLAELSSVIVLALESGGSLAELGLFSALKSFQKKLVVFISNHHYDQISFIRLGPIKFLEDTVDNRAECFPWVRLNMNREDIDLDEIHRIQPELIEALKERIPKSLTEEKFDRDRWLHKALLVCELVWLMSALTLGEINSFCNGLGINIDVREIKRIIFILEKVELISIEARSSQRFYLSSIDKSYVNWGKGAVAFDARRFQSDVLEFYKASDKKRFRALQRARGIK